MTSPMMVLYDIMSMLLNASLMFLHALPTFLNVPSTFFHAPWRLLENPQIFDGIPLTLSKALFGFKHQPWALLP
jgi:hypothetical protein